MKNDNIEFLLYRQYEMKECFEDLLRYYKTKLEELPNLKYIYNTWIKQLENDIKGCNIDIEYLQDTLIKDK